MSQPVHLSPIHFQTFHWAPICKLKAPYLQVLVFAQVFVKFPKSLEFCYFYPLTCDLLNLEIGYPYCIFDKRCKLSVSDFWFFNSQSAKPQTVPHHLGYFFLAKE